MVKTILKKGRKTKKPSRKLKPSPRAKKPLKNLPRNAVEEQKKRLEKEAYQNPAFTSRPEVVRIHLDKNGIILNINKEGEKVYGLKAKKLIGLPFSIFIHPDDLDETLALLSPEKHDAKEKLIFHKNRNLNNTGDTFYMSWICTLHYDTHGDLLYIDNVATGIMELSPKPMTID